MIWYKNIWIWIYFCVHYLFIAFANFSARVLFLFKDIYVRVSIAAQQLINPASIHEDTGSIPGLAQWVKDPALLWLWPWLAAVALIRTLAWEPPYAMGEP